MIIWSLLCITLALALFSLYLLYRAGHRPLARSYTILLLGLSLGIFLYLYGTWIYLSVYTKYVFGVLLMVMLIMLPFGRKKDTSPLLPVWKRNANLLLSGLLLMITALYFTGTTGTPHTVNLAFPLKSGRYFVLQGGKGLPTNVFHFSLRGAIYAMDIVKIDDRGTRGAGVFSRKLSDYWIFNDTVYAPCDGIVRRAYGDNPDNIPPAMDRGPKNTNQVLLEGADCYFFAGHLKRNSVVVHEGQHVKQGQALGCVGNSGFSTEPHLHIQAHEKKAGVPWYQAPPLYMLFNGKGYLLNEVISVK
ncbi:M23 family metallopeptidase [Chitinophaga sp. HK235]|uniref:M23 family metallopeptidase n=1 Tax=Chitinophaga sp. HK235 TaxID=2952571 RepID=UPI001BABE9A9|nr:M23 family metallopeptidase [Chitinophaga sp. HK235]